MTNDTQTFEARLSDRSTKELEARWLNCADQWIARYNQGSYYFNENGEQV